MPNINDFFKKEKLSNSELEKFKGMKPCNKCNKDADFYYWDPIEFIISWTCPDGHNNQYKVN